MTPTGQEVTIEKIEVDGKEIKLQIMYVFKRYFNITTAETVTYSPELNFAKVMETGYFAGFNWLTIWLKKPLPKLNFQKIVKILGWVVRKQVNVNPGLNVN